MFRRWLGQTMCLLGVFIVHPNVMATENGGFGPYGVGAQTLGSSFLPPPGKTVAYGYMLLYSAGEFVGGDGRPMISDFNLDVVAEATMMRYAWDFTYAGFRFGSALVQEAVHVSVDAAGNGDSDGGLMLLNIQPLAVSRMAGSLHLLTASHVMIPLGRYDPAASANSAHNYFTFAQEFSATWTPDVRWILDITANVSLNERNKKTGYKSGNLVGVTWAANHRPFAAAPNWQIGINGFYLRQIEDDRMGDVRFGDGFRLLKVAAGPQLAYWFSPSVAVVAKWQKEWEVRNAPKGDLLWIQAAFPL